MDEIGVPVDDGVVDLRVRRTTAGNVLTWKDSTSRARTFYRVYRASRRTRVPRHHLPDPRRTPLRAAAETLVTTRDHDYLDANPPADAVYRIGVAANWLDETDRGDVFAISPPVAP